MLERDAIIDSAKETINGERAADYGDAFWNHENIAVGWTVIAREALEKHGKITAAHAAIMMDWVKTCRLLNSIGHEDSYRDKVGYSALAYELEIRGRPSRTKS